MFKKLILMIVVLISIFGCSNLGTKSQDNSKEEKYARIRGINLSADGKYEEALKNFLIAYKYDSKNIFTVRSIGIMYCKLGDFEKGKNYFNEALKIEPGNADTLYNISVIYYNENNYQKALETLSNVPQEKITPQIIKAKAFLYMKTGEYQRSYEQFIQIIQKEDRDISVFVSYVEVLKKVGKNDEIYTFLYSLYQKHKDNLNYIFLFVDYLKDIGVYNEGIEVLKEYGNNYEFTKEVLLKITELLFENKDYYGAEKYIQVISQKDSLDERVLNWKYKIYVALNKTEEAEAIDKVLKNIKKVEKDEK